MDIARFKKLPIMGILRGLEPDIFEPLMNAIISSGLETLEIAMNSKDAAKLIREAARISNRRIMVGAGTVLNMESLKTALDSGATFIVMPTLVPDVVEYCVKNIIPVFPGALTPQEIYDAWNAGASMVKVFPSGLFGPSYFKEIKAPFDNIELMACGGVTPENIRSFFSNGASAVAFGASVFRKELLLKKDFASITQAINKLVSQCQGH